MPTAAAWWPDRDEGPRSVVCCRLCGSMSSLTLVGMRFECRDREECKTRQAIFAEPVVPNRQPTSW